MSKGASDERRRFWQGLVERQRASGLTITEFCGQAGVSQNSFYAWKRRFRATGPKSGRKRRRLGQQRELSTAPALVPVRLVGDVNCQPFTAGVIEIAWPDGLVLRVPAGCNGETLREVFGLLTSAINREDPSC